MWSFGCIVAELYLGKKFENSKKKIDKKKKIKSFKYK
jgi:hypothetical protein